MKRIMTLLLYLIVANYAQASEKSDWNQKMGASDFPPVSGGKAGVSNQEIDAIFLQDDIEKLDHLLAIALQREIDEEEFNGESNLGAKYSGQPQVINEFYCGAQDNGQKNILTSNVPALEFASMKEDLLSRKFNSAQRRQREQLPVATDFPVETFSEQEYKNKLACIQFLLQESQKEKLELHVKLELAQKKIEKLQENVVKLSKKNDSL